MWIFLWHQKCDRAGDDSDNMGMKEIEAQRAEKSSEKKTKEVPRTHIHLCFLLEMRPKLHCGIRLSKEINQTEPKQKQS